MIEQGTDGLSRGDLFTGVMAGEDFLDYIPLDKGAEVSPELEECGWERRSQEKEDGMCCRRKDGSSKDSRTATTYGRHRQPSQTQC
jgi:hypothetical protein